jgi:hypothetical protein
MELQGNQMENMGMKSNNRRKRNRQESERNESVEGRISGNLIRYNPT